MNKKLVSISPSHSVTNQYINRMKSILSGIENVQIVELPNARSLLRSPIESFHSRKIDIVILNWHENFLRSKNGGVSPLGLLKFAMVLMLYRLASKKLIYVRHNIYPHGMQKRSADLAKRIIDCAQRVCDFTVTHSGHLEGQGYFYVPHPLYENALPLEAVQYEVGSHYVVFGRIQKYKRIERLIEVWPDRGCQLVIAGPCSDFDYLAQLKNIASRKKNVVFHIGFLSELDAQNLVGSSKGLLLSHSEEDTIVSGSFFFAVTLCVPVIAKRTLFLEWVKKNGFIGLDVFGEEDQIVALLEPSRKDVYAPSRSELLAQSQLFFSDTLVKKAWEKLL